MNDCKHEYFTHECVVCWFKLGHGIPVKDSPVRNDEGTDKHRQDCIDIALIITEAKLRRYKQ